MRCLACNEEMRVLAVEPHEHLTIPGFGYHVWECPGCKDVERRLVFSPPGTAPAMADEPEKPAPVAPLEPVPTAEDADSTVRGLLKRVLWKRRGS